MVRDTLQAVFYDTQQKHAHPTFVTLQMLEQIRCAVWRGALKIRVSMVRFRPRPPNLHRSFQRDCGVFVCARSIRHATAHDAPVCLTLGR